MDLNNLSQLSFDNIILFFQSVQFLKWVFLLMVVGYIIFISVVFNQTRSMNKVFTQQSSTTVLYLIVIAFLTGALGLFLFVLRL